MVEYRIVTDEWLGYEVQSRRWWWPFWVQGETNTHHTLEAAERYAAAMSGKRVVKYLGKITPSEEYGPGEKP